MPVMDGIDATKEIISKMPSDDARPIIVAASANAVQQDVQQWLDIGMDGYLSKPLTVQKLKTFMISLGLH